MQDCFGYLDNGKGDFPESEKAACETLALPVYPELTDEQQRYVVDVISRFCVDAIYSSKENKIG